MFATNLNVRFLTFGVVTPVTKNTVFDASFYPLRKTDSQVRRAVLNVL